MPQANSMSDVKKLRLVISKVDSQLFSGDAISVTVPGSEGVMTILAHHAPLISMLREGTIRVVTPDTEKTFKIQKGVLEINSNKVTILV